MLDDGTAGLWAIKDRGGMAIVQDPLEAVAASMPQSALQHVQVDYCLPLKEIAPLLIQLALASAPEDREYPVSERMKVEIDIAKEGKAIEMGIQQLFEPSSYSCPECHGVLLQLKEGLTFRFRCHTGHAYSAASLLSAGEGSVEDALWTAIRSLDERVLLLQQLAEHLESHNGNGGAKGLLQKVRLAQQQSDLVRRALTLTDQSPDVFQAESEDV
jgi:two-component system chemotaxis response regulator CheB